MVAVDSCKNFPGFTPVFIGRLDCFLQTDIFQLFSGFFDATSGLKVEKDAYGKIAADVELNAEEMLFLTHLPTGMETILYQCSGVEKLLLI